MRRALLRQMPALTRFYFGAITYLNVEQHTLRELSQLVTHMQRVKAEGDD